MIDTFLIKTGLKLVIILVLSLIAYQDIKDRLVTWFLYPLVGFIGSFIQLYFFPKEVFILNSIVNLILIILILLIGGVYMKFIRNKSFLNESIGIGDILFFIFLSFCFPIVAFTVLLVFSLFFSLLIHFVFYSKNQNNTIPLAGLMAAFYSVVYLLSIFTFDELIFNY